MLSETGPSLRRKVGEGAVTVRQPRSLMSRGDILEFEIEESNEWSNGCVMILPVP